MEYTISGGGPTYYRVQTARARQFAVKMHGDQMYGIHPYVYHLDRVFDLLIQAGKTGPILPASFLHDILEDTPVSPLLLRDIFGGEVYELVWAVTGVGVNRRERNADIYRKLTILPRARDLKLADRIANLVCSDQKPGLRQMYLREHEGFLAAVAGADQWLLDQYLAQICRGT